MSTIKSIKAREILDSRGNPTLEVELFTNKGQTFIAKVPSGASTGINEAFELRDGDKSRYLGKGVLNAVRNVEDIISKALFGKDVLNQVEIDNTMIKLDGTKNKSKLGANAIVGVSMAVARAAACEKGVPLYRYISELAGTNIRLPVPCFNVINGGKHAGNPLPIQEFMLVPLGAPSFAEALRYGSEIYHVLKEVISKRYGLDATNVGDEGGFAPPILDIKDAFDILVNAIDLAGYTGKVKIGFDSAASEFLDQKTNNYDLDFKKKAAGTGKSSLVTPDALADMYSKFIEQYPIVFIEDPFGEEDWSSFKKFTSVSRVPIIGDDLLCTNPERIKRAIKEKTCNSLLLKINQIGTLSETIEAANLAKGAGWGCLVSHRSGETDDSFIADLVVGLGTGQIKSGAPCRFERLAKYNRLMKIEETEILSNGNKIKFAGKEFSHF
ncbi:hypothetical protein DICPUDRAFT_54877 [Dictyostelium purpureum]|uniref:phosphopyruvate hydratase n=1 Tax=Dictyostelium purpureum TaxID=5786 RepID=F0ZJC2_DICPU|nr:uncharacterized protein DICPUDRAFT_54877 [Dictyostelium purpureum]EGC35938.1 hypothetical protein DICPUDRAFT_54877 [Dictyostelium purpureum]|eukprot:XP_003287511.1 hypothetical protein DICPUDRAFT_54877 [Dictyostelium purpureum]